MVESIPMGTMVFKGDTVSVIKKILRTGLIKEIYLNRDITPYSIERDAAIAEIAKGYGVMVHAFDEVTLLPPGTLKTAAGGFFKKFTPFKNKFLEIYKNPKILPAPEFAPAELPLTLEFTVITEESPSREKALELLRDVAEPDPQELLTSKTSGVSPYIKFGVISIREAYKVFFKKKFQSLVEGLVWREFYYNIAVGFPEVLKGLPFRKETKWWYKKPTDKMFVLWTQGKTGFPVVDACMRELKATGELCGRGRMIVGSLLTKILFVDWRLGEMWFAQNLLDYDPALNNGNWQWVAGCGVDVQPYVRIFNPTLQGLKHDPEGIYVKKWVPELRDLTVKEIYDEERMGATTIVNYKKNRKIALKIFG